MFKKTVAALMLAGLASGQAFALADAGFEDNARFNAVTGAATMGANGYFWANGNVYRSEKSYIDVYDDRSSDLLSTLSEVAPVYGTYFGLLLPDTTSSNTMLTFNLGGTPTAGGESLAFRLFSAEQFTSADYTGTDGFSVTYFNVDGTSDVQSWTVADSHGRGSAFDSGWLTIAPRAGTSGMKIDLYETSADGLNAPLLLVDYAPAAPVPEPESIAMMLAGLGVLGAVSRRRSKGKAA